MTEEKDLRCLFSGEVRQTRQGNYYVEVPSHEVNLGTVEKGETYQIALIETPAQQPDEEGTEPAAPPEQNRPTPPVEEGTTKVLEIDRLGDQGDGIATLEGGFVVFVPDVDVGDRVTARIEKVEETYAFGSVVERLG